MTNPQKWVLPGPLTKRASTYPPPFSHHWTLPAFFNCVTHTRRVNLLSAGFCNLDPGSEYAWEVFPPLEKLATTHPRTHTVFLHHVVSCDHKLTRCLYSCDTKYFLRQKHPCDLVKRLVLKVVFPWRVSHESLIKSTVLSLVLCPEPLLHRMRVYWTLSLLAALSGFKGVSAGLVDEIVDAIANAVDCDSCHALLVPLKKVATMGDSELSDILSAVCKTIGVGPLLFLDTLIDIKHKQLGR